MPATNSPSRNINVVLDKKKWDINLSWMLLYVSVLKSCSVLSVKTKKKVLLVHIF